MTAKKSLLQLVAKWRKDYKRILSCAKRNKLRGDNNADSQLMAQAFSVQACADELDVLIRELDMLTRKVEDE